MSGHSKWATIKRKKELKDQKKGKLFSILVKDITIAARNGRDVETNPALKNAILRAKKENFPQGNIDRAIDRGAGITEGKAFELTYGALGPNGEVALVEVISENKNRSLGEYKQALDKTQFKFADSDSVKWNFKRIGMVFIKGKVDEEKQLELIDEGVEDIKYNEEQDQSRLLASVENLEKVKAYLGEGNYEQAVVGYVAKNFAKDFDASAIKEFLEIINDLDEVEAVWGNWE